MKAITNTRGGLVATFDKIEAALKGLDKNRQYPSELLHHRQLPVVSVFDDFEALTKPWTAYNEYDLFACTNSVPTTYCNYDTALCFKINMDRAARHISPENLPVPQRVLRCGIVPNTLEPTFKKLWESPLDYDKRKFIVSSALGMNGKTSNGNHKASIFKDEREARAFAGADGRVFRKNDFFVAVAKGESVRCKDGFNLLHLLVLDGVAAGRTEDIAGIEASGERKVKAIIVDDYLYEGQRLKL